MMPRLTGRAKLLRVLQAEASRRRQAADQRFVAGEVDRFEDATDELVQAQLDAVSGTRYIARNPTYRRRDPRWWSLLHDVVETNEAEFQGHFRVDREMFAQLVDQVESKPILRSDPSHPRRGEAELHMLVLLKYLGGYGNENRAAQHAQLLGVGKGSIANYVDRAIHAVLDLQGQTVTWPDEDERREISRRIQDKHGFPNCVGLIDGTLLPLAFAPSANGEDYYTRKSSYAVHALITCDDAARVRNVEVGWPGSVHDNRVWSNGRICQDPEQFFSTGEYLLGDSAFKPSEIMVPAFKKPPKASLNNNHAYFNTMLAGIRIKAEHCIGLIKAQFQFFQGIRIIIKDRESMLRVIRLFMCACVLHNLLIAAPMPPGWQAPLEASDTTLADDDELNLRIASGAPESERRNQLLCYLLETRYH